MWRIIIVAVVLDAAVGYQAPSYPYAKSLGDSAKEVPSLSLMTTSSAKTTQSSTTSTSTSTSTTTTTTPPPISDSGFFEPSSTTASKPTDASSTKAPSTEAPPKDEAELETPTFPSVGSSDHEDNADTPKRRVITYDQRQEGQYNIRADLENFMIVLIPPSPAEGLNLLDLLTKSSLRRNGGGVGKVKRRNHHNGVGGSGVSPLESGLAASRFRQSMKSANNNQVVNFLPRQHGLDYIASLQQQNQQLLHQVQQQESEQQQQQHHHQQQSAQPSSPRFQEFIEGRTPYHVDISSSDEEQSRLQPDRQVDVLPPPYPVAYQHLIKPYHLEAEPTVIQALPPPNLASSHGGANNFLETYNQLLASSLQENSNKNNNNGESKPGEGNFYRVSRAIRGDNLLDTNSVATSSNSLLGSGSSSSSFPVRRSQVPIYRSDLSFGAAALYPPIDVPRLSSGFLNIGSNSRTLTLSTPGDGDELAEDAHIGEILVPSVGRGDEDLDLDLDLNSASFIDSEAKSLLSDGLERCAPGRRRDSYGVCREIEGY